MLERLLSYGRQDISEEDIIAVTETLRGDFLTQGPAVEKFEEALKDYIGCPFAVSVSNGTAALHLAALALNLGPGDAAIVPALTFAATANAVLYTNATPVFADIDPDTLCLSPESVEEAISLAKRQGLRPKALFIVHFAGRPADLTRLYEVARKHDLRVVEDACHALGAEFRTDLNREFAKVGTSLQADFVVWSFHPVKHIATGEGGAITTHSPQLAEAVSMLRTHGITKNPKLYRNAALSQRQDQTGINPWYHEMQSLGFNYRMCDLQASLGASQMKRLPAFVQRRREIANQYMKLLSSEGNLTLPPADTEFAKNSYHLFALQINFKAVGKSRAKVMDDLRAHNVGSQVMYIPVCWHPYYADNKEKWLSVPIPKTVEFYEGALSIPMYPSLKNEEVAQVAGILKSVITDVSL